MKHTIQALLAVGTIVLVLCIIIAWTQFCIWLLAPSVWAIALSMAPFFVVPIGIAMWQDWQERDYKPRDKEVWP